MLSLNYSHRLKRFLLSLHLDQMSQRRMRLLVMALVGIILLLVGVLVGFLAGGGSDSDAREDDAAGPSHGPAQSSKTPSDSEDDSTFHDTDSWVNLPEGKSRKNGLPIGFPHTDTGAVAATVANNRAGWTLDGDKIRLALETYADPKDLEDPNQQEELAAAVPFAVKSARKMAGVPVKGPVPDGANLSGSPIGVQWKPLSADRVRVYVLTRVTSRAGEGEETKTQLMALPSEAIWTAGDWKMTALEEGVDRSWTPDPADLGTRKFADEGWKALREGSSR
ncbi:hypothetical protein [Streptomyces sp. NPDC006925]|uniref:hypothetical protein n=1 Tax=Streptomyces sp. NPDC006925 TaxID=3364768 RepID=UPI0036C28C10